MSSCIYYTLCNEWINWLVWGALRVVCSHACVLFQVFGDVKAILDKEGWASTPANYSIYILLELRSFTNARICPFVWLFNLIFFFCKCCTVWVSACVHHVLYNWEAGMLCYRLLQHQHYLHHHFGTWHRNKTDHLWDGFLSKALLRHDISVKTMC